MESLVLAELLDEGEEMVFIDGIALPQPPVQNLRHAPISARPKT